MTESNSLSPSLKTYYHFLCVIGFLFGFVCGEFLSSLLFKGRLNIMDRGLDVLKRVYTFEKGTFCYLDMNMRSVGKGFHFHFRKGILPQALRHYLEDIQMIASL